MSADGAAILFLIGAAALGFYAASRGLRLKHQREIIARLEDLRARQEEMQAELRGRPGAAPAARIIELEGRSTSERTDAPRPRS